MQYRAAQSEATKQSKLLAAYIAFTGLLTIKYTVRLTINHDPWTIGDWLINYSAGFIRRGLPGSVFLLAGRLTHLPLSWLVFAFSAALYVFYLGNVYLLARNIRWTWAMWALMLSPATLAFSAINPGVGICKETLLLALLALLLNIENERFVHPVVLSILLAGCVAILVLSHEALGIYMPYLLAALLLRWRPAAAIYIAALPAAVVVAAELLVIRNPGTKAMAQTICSSVGGTLKPFKVFDTGICGGGIVWLQESLPSAHQIVVALVHEFHYWSNYGFLAILAFAPVMLIIASLRQQRELRPQLAWVGICAAIAIVGSSMLFYSAFDWGRWIEIHVTCLMLLLMAVSRQSTESIVRSVPVHGPGFWLRGIALGVFATCWILPRLITSNSRPVIGYFGVFRSLYGRPTHHGKAFVRRVTDSKVVLLDVPCCASWSRELEKPLV